MVVAYCVRLSNNNKAYNPCPAALFGCVSPVDLFLERFYLMGFSVQNVKTCGCQKYKNTDFPSIDSFFDEYWQFGSLCFLKTRGCGVLDKVAESNFQPQFENGEKSQFTALHLVLVLNKVRTVRVSFECQLPKSKKWSETNVYKHADDFFSLAGYCQRWSLFLTSEVSENPSPQRCIVVITWIRTNAHDNPAKNSTTYRNRKRREAEVAIWPRRQFSAGYR